MASQQQDHWSNPGASAQEPSDKQPHRHQGFMYVFSCCGVLLSFLNKYQVQLTNSFQCYIYSQQQGHTVLPPPSSLTHQTGPCQYNFIFYFLRYRF